MSSPTVHRFTVPQGPSGRLDKFIQESSGIKSRTQILTLIALGHVLVNGAKKKASYQVQAGDDIELVIPPPEKTEIQPLNKPLEIVFEDEFCLVIEKPSGLVVHPAHGHAQDTLVNVLAFHRPEISARFGAARPGIVHRLDKETSGLLVVAKTPEACQFLANQFKRRSVTRGYWALVAGVPRQSSARIESRLTRHPKDRKKFASTQIHTQGKVAITNYRCLRIGKAITWIECRLETGRTHQIRVHLSEMGHPILGDETYGAKKRSDTTGIPWTGRIALHAFELGFSTPDGRNHLFQRPWPNGLNEQIRGLPWTS